MTEGKESFAKHTRKFEEEWVGSGARTLAEKAKTIRELKAKREGPKHARGRIIALTHKVGPFTLNYIQSDTGWTVDVFRGHRLNHSSDMCASMMEAKHRARVWLEDEMVNLYELLDKVLDE